jgi:cyclopropane-fatty-acyl-phospholipid synthase
VNSFLLTCRVEHERFSPKPHVFEYPVHTCLLNLEDLPELDKRLYLFGHNKFRLASFLDQDYLSESPDEIRTKLKDILEKHKVIIKETDTIYLVTSPRLINYAFNPVSFYWVFREGTHIACLAEVNNTFGEKHVYPLPGAGENSKFPAIYHANKTFHVSPFFDRQGEYEFSFSDIRETLTASVSLNKDGQKVFEASIIEDGERRPLSDATLFQSTLRRPFTNHLTVPRILWEAGKIHYGKKIGYHPKPAPISPMTIRHSNATSISQRLAKRLVTHHLNGMTNGSLTLELPDKTELRFGKKPYEDGGRIKIHSQAFFTKVLLHGDIGLGEAYSDGLWDTPDIVEVLAFFLANRKVGNQSQAFMQNMVTRIGGFFQHKVHQLAPRNDESGSRKNIAAHYDLSNELFSQFLDKTMTYSSGMFSNPRNLEESLIKAQKRKNRKLAEKIHIGPDDHVLEIGCGWGGFAEQIASEKGCRVTGVTVSEQQFHYAKNRIKQAGLEDRVEIRLQDYRRITDTFDKIISIEMLEAVGHDFHAEFFQRVDALLKPSGLAAIQTITIQDYHYNTYRWTMDWIRKHIFPGGLLPSLSRICEVTSKHTSLVVKNVDAIGLHYATTLRRWRDEFNANEDKIAQLGFDKYFQRTWNYYLAVCEAGFLSGHINNLQIVLSKIEPSYANN